ncbi:MAG: hypothetical protein PVF73_08265 [Bacteroidales bacterium]
MLVFSRFWNLDGYNEIIYYDPVTDSVYWQCRALCQDGKILEDNVVLQHRERTTSGSTIFFLLDRVSGIPITMKENVSLVFAKNENLALTLPLHGIRKEMEIFNTNTGSTYNRVPIPWQYSYSSYNTFDSMHYINVNGIIALDADFREIWRHELFSTKPDVKGLLTAIRYSIGQNGYFHEYAPISNSPEYTSSLHSNLLFDQESIFVCDKDYIYSLDKNNGSEQWRDPLIRETGISRIFKINDSLLIVLNTACCFRAGKLYSFGNPYYTIYSRNNGQIIESTVFEESENIRDFRIYSDTVWLLLNNGLCMFSSQGIIREKIFKTEDLTGKFLAFYSEKEIPVHIFDSTVGNWNNPQKIIDSITGFGCITDKGFLILDEDLKINHLYPLSNLGILWDKMNGITYYESMSLDNHFLFSDKIIRFNNIENSNSIFSINTPWILGKNKLFVYEGRSVYVFDLY